VAAAGTTVSVSVVGGSASAGAAADDGHNSEGYGLAVAVAESSPELLQNGKKIKLTSSSADRLVITSKRSLGRTYARPYIRKLLAL
jgi:hypothetical protein